MIACVPSRCRMCHYCNNYIKNVSKNEEHVLFDFSTMGHSNAYNTGTIVNYECGDEGHYQYLLFNLNYMLQRVV